MKKLIFVLGIILGAIAHVNGETVYLRDGSIIKGNVNSTSDDKISLQTISGTLEIKKSDIKKIEYGIRPNAIPIELSDTSQVQSVISQEEERSQSPSGSNRHNSELIFKIGYDFSGSHEVSNAQACAGGYGCLIFSDGSESTVNGYSFSTDAFIYPSNHNLGLGAGITLQTPRKQKKYEGDFYFIPVYGAIKFRTTPSERNVYLYLLGQLGLNGFYGDGTYKGDGGELSGGLYAGLGGGICLNNLIIEFLYTENNGTVDQTFFNPSLLSVVDINADVKYSKSTFSVGYRWGN